MITLTEKQITDIKEHASAAYPQECCGILLGERRTDKKIVQEVIRAQNVAGQPHAHFALAGEEILAAERKAEAGDLEIVGFYHSHPDCSTCLSGEDCQYLMPGMSYPVISVFDNTVSAIASWEQKCGGDRDTVEQEAILLAASAERAAV
jgi:proteasome lid subunit RPN8/RPN11